MHYTHIHAFTQLSTAVRLTVQRVLLVVIRLEQYFRLFQPAYD
jgi:hypothetical protein